MTLVEMKGKVLLASTITISEHVKLEHRAVIQLVDKYKSDLEEFGTFTFEMRKSAGRPIRFAWLNEEQATYLITLMKNSKIVRKFKIKLVKEFSRMRSALSSIAANQKNQEWLEKRERGKVSRLEETDAIKIYVEYAKANGSKNAGKYYTTISTMENKALFFLEQKFPNVRNALAGHQLETIANADRIVAKQLKKCVDEGRDYHDGYYMARDAIEAFSELIGKSIVHSLNPKQIK
jgi:phage regulator Rha-like protein